MLEVTRRLPELKIVINHLGRPPLPEQGWEPWATQIARAAEQRNVSMKLSIGLDIIMRWRWSTDAVRRYSDHVLDLFSPDRVMAASNWPVILLGASYAETWNGITDLVAELSAERAPRGARRHREAHLRAVRSGRGCWMPAYAGMTAAFCTHAHRFTTVAR